MSLPVQNKIPKIIMPICDDTLYTLKMSSFLFDKFWTDDTKIDVIGFKKPDFEISKKMNFISIETEQFGGANSWSRYILKYLMTIDDDLIIFTLEDFFPTASPNLKVIRSVVSLMEKDKNIGRFDLTFDSFIQGEYKMLNETSDLSLILKDKFTQYRISTQPAIWRRDFLIKILKNTTTPWDFEINGTRLSNSMTEHVLAFADPTFTKFPTYWIHKGAVSRHSPGKINVLGLDTGTIREMVSKGYFLEENLQWGMWNDSSPPTFYELGGYDFDPIKMPLHEASRTRWQEYGHVYGDKC